MKRSDLYIFGIAGVNILFFIKLASTVVFSTVASVVQHNDPFGYAAFVAFLLSAILVFNNLSKLLLLIDQEEEIRLREVIRVGKHTVMLIILYAVITLFNAYLTFSVYGGY